VAPAVVRTLLQSGASYRAGLNYCDTQCGFKAFTRAAAQTVFTRQRIERWGFDPELLFLANKFKLATVEVPVEWATIIAPRSARCATASRWELRCCRALERFERALQERVIQAGRSARQADGFGDGRSVIVRHC